GLQYRILDAQGKKTGVPIKASSLPGSPTIKNLEKKYIHNQKKREPAKLSLKNQLSSLLENRPGKLDRLIENLRKEQVLTILRQNPEGIIYGITFVDMKNKAVFNGSELGKSYSIAGLQKLLAQDSHREPKNHHPDKQPGQRWDPSLLEDLLKPENEDLPIPFEWIKKKKKNNH
ncbi:MAG: relaxase, partial [Chitinophagaceae bacterium]|nr:relaxase [Chitinophagaceae bacterium]